MEAVGDWVTWLGKSILSFGFMGTSGWIAAAIFTVFVSVGGYFLARWSREYRINEANRKTDEGRTKASAETSNEGKKSEAEGNKAADEIDKILKGK